ncbi:MAG TPA: alcohol dehydrogenase catalytic domain-containing protein [Jatrophihabitans sp.]|jgi:L-iditol 2-dehydrogenase|nr:alcohol dehydrogenase catalytic domain-containing protein [Jatrophihabitans sp.]
MLTARLHAIGDLRVHDEPTVDQSGAAQPGWSTVAVTSVGICGSDLHWFIEGGTGENKLVHPVVPGHEFAGVALSGPLAGRRVAVDPAINCQECEWCRAGRGNLCPAVRFAGHETVDGALQERLSWPDRLLHVLPDSVSDDAGALLEPLGIAIHAVELGRVRLGADALVVGAGPIGVLATQVARRAGAQRVFVSEPLAHRRATVISRGADDAWPPDVAAGALADATGGRGVDVVIEMAGTDAAIATAVGGARPGARVVLGGIPSHPLSSFPAAEARRKGLTFAMVRRAHGTIPQAITLATGGIDLDALVTARYPIGQAAEAFVAAADRTGDKTVIAVGSSVG